MAGICWIEGIAPVVMFDSCYFLSTLIVLCSCHLIDAENNLRASIIEAVFMLVAMLAKSLQTGLCLSNLYMGSRLIVASITLIML